MYVQRHFLMMFVTYSCFVSSLSKSFDLKSFQLVFVIFLRHLFSKATSFLSIIAVDFQLSHPYVNNRISLALNSRSLMCLLAIFDLQMFESLLKALEARAIRVLISELVSPSAVILLPKYTKFETLSGTLSSSLIDSVRPVKFMIFVLCVFV